MITLVNVSVDLVGAEMEEDRTVVYVVWLASDKVKQISNTDDVGVDEADTEDNIVFVKLKVNDGYDDSSTVPSSSFSRKICQLHARFQ